MRCSIFVQPSSILLRRFHHRLPVCASNFDDGLDINFDYQRIPSVDEPGQLKSTLELVDWLLPPISNDDHWIQEEETWPPLREVVGRCSTRRLARGHFLRGHLPYRHGRPLRCLLHVRQIVP